MDCQISLFRAQGTQQNPTEKMEVFTGAWITTHGSYLTGVPNAPYAFSHTPDTCNWEGVEESVCVCVWGGVIHGESHLFIKLY